MLRYSPHCQGMTQFFLHPSHTHTFIYKRNEPYLPLPSHPELLEKLQTVYRVQQHWFNGQYHIKFTSYCCCARDLSWSLETAQSEDWGESLLRLLKMVLSISLLMCAGQALWVGSSVWGRNVMWMMAGVLRYWRQRADERFGDPPPKVDPGAFSGQRQGWKTPRGLPGSALLLCV